MWRLARSRNRRPQEVEVLPPEASVIALFHLSFDPCSTSLLQYLPGVLASASMPRGAGSGVAVPHIVRI